MSSIPDFELIPQHYFDAADGSKVKVEITRPPVEVIPQDRESLLSALAVVLCALESRRAVFTDEHGDELPVIKGVQFFL